MGGGTVPLIALLISFLLGFGSGFSFADDNDIQQIMKDPRAPGNAWALSKKELRFSDNPGGGRWDVRFDESLYKKLFRKSDASDMELIKVSPASSERGALYLILEASGPRGKQRYTLIGRNEGRAWKIFSTNRPSPARGAANAPAPAAAPSVAKRPEAPANNVSTPPAQSATRSASPAASGGGAANLGTVDLASLDTGSDASSGGSYSASPNSGGIGIPEFRFMFDFWLYHRPAIAPLTFSNIHTLAMVDILPVPELQFSFELSPTPRYYQVSYNISRRLELRAGRIWIPFDQIGPSMPHNLFGGFVNVSQFRQPGGTAFLPDIWTDLGVGVKYTLADTDRLSWAVHAYVVNGFQDGGSDPTSQVGTRYPNFESAAAIDNNSDKAFGFRSHAMWRNRFGLGISGYMGRYTDAADESHAIMMLGVDAQMKFGWGFDVKAGYAFMNVGLPSAASASNYRRGGMYIEGTQRLGRTWKVFARGGTVQNDSRVVGVDDVTMVGGGIIYTLGYLQLTVMYQHDMNTVSTKTSYDLMATRAAIML
jgi:hypothetical protein